MMMELTDPNYVYLIMDTGHNVLGGMDVVKITDEFFPRITEFHLKDTFPQYRGNKEGPTQAMHRDNVLHADETRHARFPVLPSAVFADPQIAGKLFDNEAIVGQVAAIGIDHPVAPRPLSAVLVVVEAIGVGVAGRVEPGHRHPLGVARRRQ
jgi:inosose dehydratase